MPGGVNIPFGSERKRSGGYRYQNRSRSRRINSFSATNPSGWKKASGSRSRLFPFALSRHRSQPPGADARCHGNTNTAAPSCCHLWDCCRDCGRGGEPSIHAGWRARIRGRNGRKSTDKVSAPAPDNPDGVARPNDARLQQGDPVWRYRQACRLTS